MKTKNKTGPMFLKIHSPPDFRCSVGSAAAAATNVGDKNQRLNCFSVVDDLATCVVVFGGGGSGDQLSLELT
jgi:hypothetical protein